MFFFFLNRSVCALLPTLGLATTATAPSSEERVALNAVSKGVREALASEVASLHRQLRTMNEALEERLKIFEDRLKGDSFGKEGWEYLIFQEVWE